MKLSRRDFIRTAAAAVAGATVMPIRSLGAVQKKARLVVVEGKDVAQMLAKGIAELGGWKKFVTAGKKATVKPNIAWVSKPEEGGNTDPGLVGAVVAACKAAQASEIVVPEKTCSPYKQSFAISGIADAVKKAGGRIYSPGEGDFKKVSLPGAKNMKEAAVVSDVLETGCLINMPVAKDHSAAGLTLAMKNWMGSVEDRGFLHRNNLHQCIADLSTLIKADLIILDATRIMLTNGPRGPGKLDHPNRIIFGTDPVAVDAYASTLFGKKPFDIQSIKIAHDMGIGCGELSEIEVVELKV